MFWFWVGVLSDTNKFSAASPCWPRLCLPLLSYRSDSCSCVGQKHISGCLLQKSNDTGEVECFHFIMSCIQWHKNTKIVVSEMFIVHLVSLGCSRLILSVERDGLWQIDQGSWMISLFFLCIFFIQHFSFYSLWRLLRALSSTKLSSAASLLHCRNVGEAAWWRSLEAEPEASSHAVSAVEPDSPFVWCFLPSLPRFPFC